MLSYTGIDIVLLLGLVSSAKNNWNFRLLKPEAFFFSLRQAFVSCSKVIPLRSRRRLETF